MRRVSVLAVPPLAAGLAFALLVPGTAPVASARPAVPAVTTATPTLVAVRAAHHPGFDRLVFQFAGGLPAQRSVSYERRILSDASGLPLRLAGSAYLLVRFSPADGHNAQGRVTYGPTRRAYALPNIMEVANAGDFEAVLTFGVGLARRAPVHTFALTGPSRFVIDVGTRFRTVPVRTYFLDRFTYASGHQPYVRAVRRPAIPPAVANGALQRLFAGPTQAEKRRGLAVVLSGASGFRNLSIRHGIARVRLTGGCSSGGSTFTIADEIIPTLKQFRSVRAVKIYDPSGHTERPTGRSDSIPTCLEP